MKKQIEPNTMYSLRALLELNAWPWASSYTTYRSIVDRDRESENLLAANISGEGKGTRIFIKGANALRLRQRFEAGTYAL